MPEQQIRRVIISLLLLVFVATGCNPATPETPPTATTSIGSTETPLPSPPTPTPETATATTVAEAELPTDQIWIRTGNRVVPLEAPDQELTLEPPADGFIGFITAAPDGSFITYDTGEQVLLRNLSSGETRGLTEETGITTFRPRFSPDSQALVYTAIGQQEWELRRQNLTDGTETGLQTGPNTAFFGALEWVPTGIIGEQLMWQTDAPPQALLQLDPSGGTVATLREANHITASATDDGQQFALLTGSVMLGPGLSQQELFYFNSTSGMTTTLVPQTDTNFGPVAISPDGTKVFYARTTNPEPGSPFEIMRVTTSDGSGEWVLDQFSTTFTDVAWSDATNLLLLTLDDATLTLTSIALGNPGEFTTEELGTVDVIDGDTFNHIAYVPGS